MAKPPLPYLDFSIIGPKLGERFPNVTLPDQHEQSIDLHAARGDGKAIVVFYRSASW